MPAPTRGTKNDFSVAAAFSTGAVSLANAPSAGGVIVTLASVYTGGGGGSWSMSATGGTGVTITKKLDEVGVADAASGLLIWTVEYTTAPTALTITRSGSAGDSPYISGSHINVSGQAAGTFIDVISATASTGTSASPVATSLPDLTDSTALVLGVMTRNSAGGGQTIAPASGWSEVVEFDQTNTSFQACSIIERTPGATGAFDPAWTLEGSDAWHAAGIAIKGTSGGGGGTSFLPIHRKRHHVIHR